MIFLGTSTDVSRFDGHYDHVVESTTAGVTIQAPQLDINTVAAGGGSQLFFRSGMYVVGPESAGAHPGRSYFVLLSSCHLAILPICSNNEIFHFRSSMLQKRRTINNH